MMSMLSMQCSDEFHRVHVVATLTGMMHDSVHKRVASTRVVAIASLSQLCSIRLQQCVYEGSTAICVP
eukprot:7229-Heterococcus_DN1.PRE.3